MSKTKTFKPDRDVKPWTGGYRPYDIAKELTVCILAVLVITIGLAVIFGSPDEKSVTIQSWSNANQVDFAQTAITELDGSSASATYGAPYNNVADTGQKIGPLALESWAGVTHPVDPPKDFVLGPLSTVTGAPGVQAALARYNAASPAQQAKWQKAYEDAVKNAKEVNGVLVVPPGPYGPVGPMIAYLTAMAKSGALDTSTVAQSGFFSTDYTKPLLFISDGAYLADLGTTHHLSGDQWGMMNETGSFPGQAWLWLYTMWYQVSPFNNANSAWGANADALIWALMMLLTVILALLPFIPGLRSIPRWTRIYRLIWRDYYKGRV